MQKKLTRLLKNAQAVLLTFTDPLGKRQEVTTVPREIDENSLRSGIGFDGSSIKLFSPIQESDMLLVPDEATAFMDPFCAVPTVSLTCDIRDPVTGKWFTRDPRYVARQAQAELTKSGLADTMLVGPEPEFFIFDGARYQQNAQSAHYEVDAEEAVWNSDTQGNRGHNIRHKEGYVPARPEDKLGDIRTEMLLTLEKLGIQTEKHHHEVATAGQAEIDLVRLPLLAMADATTTLKYVVKNVAAKHGKTATFMAKPIFGDNGNGMHVHQSLWKGGKPQFAGKRYAGLSDMALWYIGGLLKHARALSAFCAPTVNSYKRLVPGFEAPTNLVYSGRNRSAAIRIPLYSNSPKAKRVEFRCPDPTANPYLAFAAMLMAGLDGIREETDPGKAVDENIYESKLKLPQLPGSLSEALDALEDDHFFLGLGRVFTEDLVQAFIAHKRQEVAEHNMRPTPYEFCTTYDA